MKSHKIGVGPTEDLALRVSAAALARVIFTHPDDGTRMLALEHKAYVSRGGQPQRTVVKAQPFGGAVRIIHRDRFAEVVGGFNFDSERSRVEQDFRIFIQPSRFSALQEYAAGSAGSTPMTDLEISPSRELEEEFEDTLAIALSPAVYTTVPAGIILQRHPAPTSNLRALGKPTARIYWVYEITLKDPELGRQMLDNSQAHSGRQLGNMAEDRHRSGARGRANAVLVAPLDAIRQAYVALDPDQRGEPIPFEDTILAGNVAAILDGVLVPRYERIA
jgi:hypothetical protein